MKRGIPMVLLAAAAIAIGGPDPSTFRPVVGPPAALAQDGGWKAEYDAVCSKTDVAMTLTPEELQGLITRCDRLKPKIEAEEESTRKVYSRRLRMCRDLYQYVLESKEGK